MTLTAEKTRLEKDSLGTKEVPADAYYGIHALRGHENFPISGFTPAQFYPVAIKAYGQIKKAAAQANMELGVLDPLDPANNEAMGKAMMAACDEMITGRFKRGFHSGCLPRRHGHLQPYER